MSDPRNCTSSSLGICWNIINSSDVSLRFCIVINIDCSSFKCLLSVSNYLIFHWPLLPWLSIKATSAWLSRVKANKDCNKIEIAFPLHLVSVEISSTHQMSLYGSVSIVRRFDSPKIQLKLNLALTLTLTLTDTGDLWTIEPSDYQTFGLLSRYPLYS